jgi:diguanylate cyclase (GGDEF)-like protein
VELKQQQALEDSDLVRHNFRILMLRGVLLAILANIIYGFAFYFADIAIWHWNIFLFVLWCPIYWLLALDRTLSLYMLGVFLAAAVTIYYQSMLSLMFGTSSGFHIPMIAILPLIVVGARATRPTKWIVILLLGSLLVWLDSDPAITLNENVLSIQLAWWFHLMNSFLTIIAISGLMFHYFGLVTRQYKNIRDLAMTDSLTLLSNRHYMQESAMHSLKQAQRYGYPFTVLLCDLDHFKTINDNFGHDAGDEVLRHCSRILKQHARKSDYVGRWGGEEFVLFLPHTKVSGAVQLAERIRESIETSLIIFNGNQLKVTISIGISSLEKDDNLESIIARADDALYLAKATGRNKVEFKILNSRPIEKSSAQIS